MNKSLVIRMAVALLLAACLGACSMQVENPMQVDELPRIYPDYVEVTIPADIAPMNFNFDGGDIDCMDVVVKGSKGGEMHTQGDYADFDAEEWRELTEQNISGALTFTVCVLQDGTWRQYRDFKMQVSSYRLDDYGLTYRRIPPGCMNCHTPNRANPQQFTLQIRGEGGGTMVQKEGVQRWYDTKTDSTKAAGSYAYWHPQGDYCAYATNSVHQSFFTGTGQRIEVYHKFSDIIILDTRTNELVLSPLLQTPDLEIFPAFSADGKTLYYSTSKPCDVPAEYEKVKCSLCAIPFDAQTGSYGSQVDTLLNGPKDSCSYVLARPSYEGRWLMYTRASRSNFPVCQPDADLWLMDLKTGEVRRMDEVNSPDVESYHNWSSDSRWFVFTSKRENGMYAQLFLACMGDDGKATKPFLLPQRNPKKFYFEMMDSYNVPDFTKTKVDFDMKEAYRQVFGEERVHVQIK